MSETTKPRVRVSAGSTSGKSFVGDSFVNWRANLGYGADNLVSGGTYGFTPISRNRTMLEWMYRGAWLVRQVVDAVADDMVRAGVSIESDMPPDAIDKLQHYWGNLQIWRSLNLNMKWARLYGGSIAYMMIEGQDPSSPLRIDTVNKGQFKGLMVLDRWMVWPHLEDLVTTLGPDFSLPKYYDVVADARSIPRMRIHHSRVIRFDGDDLPYWQRLAENNWGLSVLEPMFDRLLAYDSVTSGAAQLAYRAHLRVLRIPELRQIIGMGGTRYNALLRYVEIMRLMQSNEGITLIDGEDEFQAHQYAFGGLSDLLVQFGQQISGAAKIPLTRLFGQAPAGMNATGESDMRNYYDAIRSAQESRMRLNVRLLFQLTHRSRFGEPLPDGFEFSFNPLWQMTDGEKVTTAATLTQAVEGAVAGGIIGAGVALKELRQQSRITGVWTNITDEMIEQADEMPPAPEEMVGGDPAGEHGMEQGAEQPQEVPALGPPGGAPQVSPDEVMPDDFAEHQRYEPEYAGLPGASDAATADTTPPMREFHGLPLVIETPKDSRRLGYGWAVQMPADYGYIQGTSSSEGPLEQMDCFVGPDQDSQVVWVIEQIDPETKLFDEHKCMLGFVSKDDAVATYCKAFNDNSGKDRIGTVRRMHINVLKNWLKAFPAGVKPNGSGNAAHS